LNTGEQKKGETEERKEMKKRTVGRGGLCVARTKQYRAVLGCR
jgi:hypothetical protein